MATYYEPSDGDYIEDKKEEYGKFFDAIQDQDGIEIGEFPEICATYEESGMIKVLGANEECDEWIWEQLFYTPEGWTSFQVAAMFEGTVYLQPATRPTPRALDGDNVAQK